MWVWVCVLPECSDPDNVPKGEFLEKYARNITKMAEEGKLDPIVAATI